MSDVDQKNSNRKASFFLYVWSNNYVLHRIALVLTAVRRVVVKPSAFEQAHRRWLKSQRVVVESI